jgi:hypothetical protein
MHAKFHAQCTHTVLTYNASKRIVHVYMYSKVFLRHIAPALYRDQDLVSGPHISAGHAELSTRVCSSYICYVVALILELAHAAFGNGCIFD